MRSSRLRIPFTKRPSGAIWIFDHYENGSRYKKGTNGEQERVIREGHNGEEADHEKINVPDLIRATFKRMGAGIYDGRESFRAVRQTLKELKEVEKELQELKSYIEKQIASGKKPEDIEVPKFRRCSNHRKPKNIDSMMKQIPRIRKEFEKMVLEYDLARKNDTGEIIFDRWKKTHARVRARYIKQQEALGQKKVCPTPPARG